MSKDDLAYGSYQAFCALVNVAPMSLDDWTLWGRDMEPEQQKDCPVSRRPRSLFDRQQSASFLDLEFPSLHRDEEGISYTVVGPA
jgi:hypothetical protein